MQKTKLTKLFDNIVELISYIFRPLFNYLKEIRENNDIRSTIGRNTLYFPGNRVFGNASIFQRTPTIKRLTTGQRNLLVDYHKKWKSLELSHQRINLPRAKQAVRSLYAALRLSEPKIVFARSPYTALNKIIHFRGVRDGSLRELIERQLRVENLPISGLIEWDRLLTIQMINLNTRKAGRQRIVAQQLGMTIARKNINRKEIKRIYRIVWHQLYSNCIVPDLCTDIAAWLDFQSNVLKTIDTHQVSYHLCRVIQECGWIFSFDGICVICDRPVKIHLDNRHRLHAEGKPAIQFNDGFGVYAYHGVGLPEKYSKLHPSKWRTQWLLEERNAELRRVLIQAIGYDRICQELQSRTVDTWKEYALLSIASRIGVEPMCLLKMTCPSTRHIHALRVPPTMRSAREAIRWVNGGIDPEEFSVAS